MYLAEHKNEINAIFYHLPLLSPPPLLPLPLYAHAMDLTQNLNMLGRDSVPEWGMSPLSPYLYSCQQFMWPQQYYVDYIDYISHSN